MSRLWQWLYVYSMAAGTLLFGYWLHRPKGVPRVDYALVIGILLWSGAWYLVMALGGGRVTVAGETVYWARYVDWIVTTPLLLIALTVTATQALTHKHRGLLTALVLADLTMVLSGLAAELTANVPARFLLYALGVLALLTILGLIQGPLRAAAARQPEPMTAAHREGAVLLSALWTVYPLVWILGPAGFGLFGDTTDTALLVVLSILAKLVWSILDLGRLRALSDRCELAVA